MNWKLPDFQFQIPTMLLGYIGCVVIFIVCVVIFIVCLAYHPRQSTEPSYFVQWPLAPASIGEDVGSTLQRGTLPGIPSRVYMSDDGLLHIVFMGPDPLLGRDAAGSPAESAAIPGGSDDDDDDSQPLEHCSLPPPI